MMEKNSVLVLLPVEQRHKEILEAAAPGVEFIYATADVVTKQQVQDAQVIVGNPPVEYVAGSTNLKWFQSNTAGPDPYLKEGVIQPSAIITNATGAYGLAISEYMLGVLLSLYKKLYAYRDQQHTHQWNKLGTVKKVNGSTVLVIGMGDIGGSFAKLVKSMGAYVIGVRRTDITKPDYVDEVHLTDALDSLLPRADVVAMSLPGNSQTAKILNRERIGKMKPGAVHINVGRGTAIDTEALCDAQESGHLGGVALDVTDPEPLPADHRLWNIPNAIITPHVSGGWSLPETFERIVRISAENLRRYFLREPLRNVIDRNTRYRKL